MNQKRYVCVLPVLVCCYLLGGCISKVEKSPKLRDVKYTIVEKEDIPPEMAGEIERQKEKPFHLVYSDQGKTYLVEGYGACHTTGYSIEVNELYETEHTICFHTSLMGPAAGEETKEITTFPYLVVQIEETEKEVEFD